MQAKIFLSYRRDDSRYQARMIYESFCRELPRENVFMDVSSIPSGRNFRKVLRDWVNECDVLLALIGPGWSTITDPRTGQRRLECSNDCVRIEIGEALLRDIPVVPVLLDGAPMPEADELPPDLRELVDRNAEFVEFRTFDADVAALIRKAIQPADVAALPPSAPGLVLAGTELTPEPRLVIPTRYVRNRSGTAFLPGSGRCEWFRDQVDAPEMVVLPAGAFRMGSPDDEPERETALAGSEGPLREVVISAPLAMARHAVTRGQFAAFVAATAHRPEPGACVWTGSGWRFDPEADWQRLPFAQDGGHPVVAVSWHDAKAYCAWLTRTTGEHYRLPSEAEREYAARAGTRTPFWWGDAIAPDQARYASRHAYNGGITVDQGSVGTARAVSHAANPWGLFNMHGNIWEWCEDCWHDTYVGAPSDGRPWLEGAGHEGRRVVRGGCWLGHPRTLRSADRSWVYAGARFPTQGFRVVREIRAAAAAAAEPVAAGPALAALTGVRC
jgi:formylglycine-generating enzyme required for sulfatase activity